MNLLPFAPKTAAAPIGLSEQLLDLARFGKPRVGVYAAGWSASVEMNTNTTGTSFEVRSGFDHRTPDEAVAECAQRVRTALAALTKV